MLNPKQLAKANEILAGLSEQEDYLEALVCEFVSARDRIKELEAENRELILCISDVKRPNEKAEDTKVRLIARVLKREKDNDGAGYWCCKADFWYHEKTCENYENDE